MRLVRPSQGSGASVWTPRPSHKLYGRPWYRPHDVAVALFVFFNLFFFVCFFFYFFLKCEVGQRALGYLKGSRTWPPRTLLSTQRGGSGSEGGAWSVLDRRTGGPEGLEDHRTAGKRCPVRFQRRVLPAGAPLNLDVSMAARAASLQLLLLLLLLWIFTCTVSPGRVGRTGWVHAHRTGDRPSSVGARTI